MNMLKILSVFGTRPEAIKMCPLVKKLEECKEIESIVCLTGQHKEMLQQVIDIFAIDVKYNLNIMKEEQTLTSVTVEILEGIEAVLLRERPDLVLVHGDTTTSFAAALASFYQKIPVGHVEAGLRTNDKYLPFPEEINRSLTGKIAELHFAPTERSKNNLLSENITKNIFVTGNTVIDAFKTTVRQNYSFKNESLCDMLKQKKSIILVTAHRRENVGLELENICRAIMILARKYCNLCFAFPVHLNPAVQRIVVPRLNNIENVFLMEPIDVEDMHNILPKCFMVLTDSGGLQEEAPHFGVPVLVLRSETERPEAVTAGTVKVIGTETQNIVAEVEKLLYNQDAYDAMAKAVNPYGDGNACERIVKNILEWRGND